MLGIGVGWSQVRCPPHRAASFVGKEDVKNIILFPLNALQLRYRKKADIFNIKGC